MSLRGRLLTTLGFVAVVLGLLFALQPSFAFDLGGTRSLLIGLLALVQGARLFSAARERPIEGAETPDPEVRSALPRAGDEFDDLLARTRGRRRSDRYNREAVEERLEAVAVDALVRRGNESPDGARRKLDEGTWTTDPYAAAFFAGGSPSVSLRERLSHAVSRESRFQRRARHAVDAIDAMARRADGGAER